MKKLIMACGVALALTASLTGCSNGSSNQASSLGDSLATAFGNIQGAQFLEYYNRMDSADRAKFSKDALLRGLKQALFSDTTDQGYLTGQNVGMGFLSEIMQIERMSDIRIDRKKLYDAFAATIKNDSAPNMQELQGVMQDVSNKVRSRMDSYQREQKMNAPEAQENIKAGKAFIDKQKKADAAVKTTESGLAYKVVNQGTGETVKPTDRVMVNYVGKHVNGEQFDSSNGNAIEMSPMGVVPGFKEALLMMNKGAKYEVYIPGDLAYGVDGRPGKIAPMETLVFEVEVVDIIPAPDASQAKPAVQVVPAQ